MTEKQPKPPQGPKTCHDWFDYIVQWCSFIQRTVRETYQLVSAVGADLSKQGKAMAEQSEKWAKYFRRQGKVSDRRLKDTQRAFRALIRRRKRDRQLAKVRYLTLMKAAQNIETVANKTHENVLAVANMVAKSNKQNIASLIDRDGFKTREQLAQFEKRAEGTEDAVRYIQDKVNECLFPTVHGKERDAYKDLVERIRTLAGDDDLPMLWRQHLTALADGVKYPPNPGNIPATRKDFLHDFGVLHKAKEMLAERVEALEKRVPSDSERKDLSAQVGGLSNRLEQDFDLLAGREGRLNKRVKALEKARENDPSHTGLYERFDGLTKDVGKLHQRVTRLEPKTPPVVPDDVSSVEGYIVLRYNGFPYTVRKKHKVKDADLRQAFRVPPDDVLLFRARNVSAIDLQEVPFDTPLVGLEDGDTFISVPLRWATRRGRVNEEAFPPVPANEPVEKEE